MPAVAPNSNQRPPGSNGLISKLTALPPAIDDDEETTTDESSDEAAALEMDGQELWTQTFCANCDCLIEPGEGLASKQAEATANDSGMTTPSTGLKSRSGTIKARTSEDRAQHPSNADKPKESNPSNLKRTHSAGRLHARGGVGPLAPHKRTGSAGSRLNALSELRPTTKLHPTTGEENGKGKSKAHEVGGKGRKSPALSRRGSSASTKSGNHSSGPSSIKSNEASVGPVVSSTGKSKARSLLGGLTPAALRQQQEELTQKKKAPAQLYCSERCRTIDEQRSAGLGELSQYLSQPLIPQAPAAWSHAPWSAGPPASGWPRSTSMSSVPLPLLVGTPDSECMCPECMDKYAEIGSASGGTVPSGASDTTESSSSYMYGRPRSGQKRRTASGRIVTPLNLHPPGAAPDGYFPVMTAPATRRPSTSSPRIRAGEGVPVADARSTGMPPRTSPSAGPVGSAGTVGTDTSTVSSASAASLWEPRLKKQAEPSKSNARARSSTNTSVPENGSGNTTVTGTPAITPRHSVLASARHMPSLSVPILTPANKDEAEATTERSPAFSGSVKAEPSLATSPLNLLSRSAHNHAAPTLDVWNEHVGSPSTKSSLLSRSLASEHTLMGGASGITLAGVSGGHSAGHGHQRSTSSTGASATASSQTANDPAVIGLDTSAHGMGRSSSRDAHGRARHNSMSEQNDLSLAVGSLKLAQSRSNHRHSFAEDGRRYSRHMSLFGVGGATQDYDHQQALSSSVSSSNSGWLKSISSAWNALRGVPPDAGYRRDSDSVVAVADDDLSEGYTRRPSEDAYSRRASTASRTSETRYGLAPWLRRGDLSMSGTDTKSANVQDTETPTQSLVAKPTIRRGTVPAFAREIGQGDIPGEASDNLEGQPSSIKSNVAQAGTGSLVDSRRQSVSLADVLEVSDEEEQRRRRRQERKDRRSREIHVLPPLLAPISRNSSSTNLYAHMPRSARGHVRARTQSNTPQMVVGSAGSGSHSAHLPQRSTTPSLAAYANAPSSPTVMRSPYPADARGFVSPTRPGSASGMYSTGTSPRAKGLGWGAMTSMTPVAPPLGQQQQPAPFGSAGAAHGLSTSIGYGHAAMLANRSIYNAAHAPGGTHGHHAHAHRQHHHQHHHHGHQSQRPSHAVRHSTTGSNGLTLGHIGTLGVHPHGLGVVAGRHSTMPSMMHRSPTPTVPEDGGEMSSHELTGCDMVARPNSAMAQHHRHRNSLVPPPPRSRSSVGVHNLHGLTHAVTEQPHHEQHHPAAVHASMSPSKHTWSYDALPGLKTYPLLQLPDRETHDVYDAGWGLGDGGLAKHLTGRALNEQQQQHEAQQLQQQEQLYQQQSRAAEQGSRDARGSSQVQTGFAPAHRKKLFYFDA